MKEKICSSALLLVAMPFGGKDTQLDKLKEVLARRSIPHFCIETGNELKKMPADNHTKIIYDEMVGRGDLVPDWLANGIASEGFRKNFYPGMLPLFNGFPRNIPQAEILIEMTKFYGLKVKVAVLKVTKEEARRRLEKGEREARSDDKSLSHRFQIFEECTQPIINFLEFKEGFEVIYVDGEKTIEEIHQEILQIVGLQ